MRTNPPLSAGLAAVSLALLLAAWPGAARAAFGDCADPAYRAGFDARLRDIDYDCVERPRVDIATPFGRHQVRVLHDLSADWVLDAPLLAEVERGVRLAADALGRIGRFEIVDVSLLIADDLPPDGSAESVGGIAAITNYGGRPDECQVVFYALGPGADTAHAAAVVAHEIFHCVQRSTFDPALLRALGARGGPAWWLEGSADWFASMAVPDPAYFQSRADDFDAGSADTALNLMSYESLPFFLWLAADRGDEGVLPFLAALSQAPGARAQQASMAAALPADDWLRFAQDYLDGRIARPAGGMVFAPRDGADWRWDDSRTQTVRLQPFVLSRAQVSIACGRWRLQATPERWHGARPDDGADWGVFPPDLDTLAGDPEAWRFAGLLAAADPAELGIRAEQRSGCGDCAGSVRTDRCLVGTWQMTGGGAAEWIRSQLPPGVSMPMAEQTGALLVLNADGSFSAGRTDLRATMEARGPDGTARARMQGQAQASGRWSAEDGRLNLCPAAEGMGGRAHVTQPRGPAMDIAVGVAGSRPSQLRYTCSDTALETEQAIPGSPPMRTRYAPVR